MKKKLIFAAASAAVLLTGCAKSPASGLNDARKAYLEAWIKVHHPDAKKTSLGAYILDETAGSGEALGAPDHSPYVLVNYTVTDIDGNITETTSEALAKQLGTYDEINFYGPRVWNRLNYGVTAGVEESLASMKTGGERTVMIPGWLLSSIEYSDAGEYFANGKGADAIYTIDAVERIPDIVKWGVDSLSSYMQHNYPSVALADSLKYGFYYVRLTEPLDTCGFKKDTTIYVNYIGRLLNGTVFDTNIADTAKCYGLYKKGKTYGPAEVTCAPDYTASVMGSSSMIDGFAYAISQMHTYEAGTAIFYSRYGYDATGSGETIPPYSPLRFDIEVVSK